MGYLDPGPCSLLRTRYIVCDTVRNQLANSKNGAPQTRGSVLLVVELSDVRYFLHTTTTERIMSCHSV